jgi:hypothetical protein
MSAGRKKRGHQQVSVDPAQASAPKLTTFKQTESFGIEGQFCRWESIEMGKNESPVVQVPHANSPATQGCINTIPFKR